MKAIIKEIINNFAEQGIVFSNEQDFQFEMALALKTGNYGIKNVKLETISLEEDWNEIERKVLNRKKLNRQIKQYHDILVELSDDEYALIELKYKTPSKLCFYETSQGKTITFVQGDYNIGAYDFLEDIHRLETINNRYMSNDIQKKIKKSYAVFLTNDKNYRYNDFAKQREGKVQSPWVNYSICEGKIIKDGRIPFIINNREETKYTTPKGKCFDSISLKNKYGPFNWQNYELPNYNNYEDKKVNRKSCTCPGFSYLIVEVKPI
ncbi:MAG: hypothetical protein J5955_03330 [Bacilli bacterium]|nr:hypothetical protein [Bacilli bacterium]